MRFTTSLRAKVLLSALVPMVVVLAIVAVTTLNLYERRARVVVEERDAELAKITAARLSESLTLRNRILENLAADDDVQSMDPSRLRTALEGVQDQLFAFDAGVVIYDRERTAVWSDPFAFERREQGFPLPSEFDEVRNSSLPRFSDVFMDAHSGEHAILLGVPIVASGGEFVGILVGLDTLRSLVSDPAYSSVLQIAAGREGFAYLVDGIGRVIYHRDGSQLAEDLSRITPVTRALGGDAGAVIADNQVGEVVISGFAPVPGTDWAVITEESWSNVVGPIQQNSRLLLGLILGGAIVSGALVLFTIGRVLRPIGDLSLGAQRIAGGDFDYTIDAKSGDEFQELAHQFNVMASALKDSYAGLEQRVADRTEELQESSQALQRNAEDLRRSNADLEQFAYVASHDLQEPLRAIVGFSKMLARRYEGRLDETADDYIARTVNASGRMQALINDLLEYSRVGRGLETLESTDCEAIFDQAIGDLRSAIDDDGAVVTRDSLPTLMANPTMLNQVFSNLIANAIKFSGERPARVHVSAMTTENEWRFSVRDDGIGLEPRFAERIFVIFQRLHGRAEYPGTGIGLAVCKKALERLGGRIWVESKPGEGATFYFTIPVTLADEPLVDQSSSSAGDGRQSNEGG